MAAGCGYERCDNANEIVVHISGVSKCLRTSRHDSRDLFQNQFSNASESEDDAYQLVGLIKSRCLDMQSISRYTGQRQVIEDDDRICVICQPLERQHGVIGLHDDVALLGIWKDRVCLDEFLREPVVETFKNERAET